MKRLIAFLLVFSTIVSTSVYASEKKENSEGSISTLYVSFESNDFDSEYWYNDDGVKTYYISVTKILEELDSKGYDISKIFSQEELEEIKLEEQKLEKLSIASKRERTSFTSNYSRVWVSKGVIATVASVGISALTGGLLSFTSVFTKIGAADLALNFPDGFYIHDLKTPFNNGSIKKQFLLKENQTKWFHETLEEYITDSYPKEKYNFGTYWYYIKNDVFAGADGEKWKIINGKWYEFNEYGMLIENEGWKVVNGKWMYFIPGDFGGYRSTTENIKGEKFTFDSDGYCVEGRGCN